MSQNSHLIFDFNISVKKISNGFIWTITSEEDWKGVCLVCSRDVFLEAKKHWELSQPGVYLLWGKDEKTGADKFYIGESGRALKERIDNHYSGKKKKDFHRIVVFTREEASPLSGVKSKHIEMRLYKRGCELNRCVITNEQRPAQPNISPPDRRSCDSYFKKMMIILPLIGIDAFDSSIVPTKKKASAKIKDAVAQLEGKQKIRVADEGKTLPDSAQQKECVFKEFKEGKKKGGEATGYYKKLNKKFVVVVKKGSCAKKHRLGTLNPPSMRERKNLIESGVLVDEGDIYRLVADTEWLPPSRAAAVLAGKEINGLEAWVDKESGKTLKELQEG